MNDKEIADKLGIGSQTAAKWRKNRLNRGQHWRMKMGRGGGVIYTKPGIEMMAQFKEMMPKRKKPDPKEPKHDAKYHDEETITEVLTVWQLGMNKRCVMAKRDNGEFVRLIIMEKDYDRGIKCGRRVRAAWMESESDIWNMIGISQENIDQHENPREQLAR